MSTDSVDAAPVSVRILDKEYRVACPPGERDALRSAARYLHDRMQEVRDNGKVIGTDRIAVMVALNIAHEMIDNQNQLKEYDHSIRGRIKDLQDKIELALNESKQMEL